jgi:enamine deaminase RidA (YjgF/YER057c/UK114 family)
VTRHRLVNPEDLGLPKGYSHGVLAAPGRTLYVAGQIGWDAEERIVSDRFAAQFDKALENALRVVEAAGGEPSDVCRMTIYVADKQAYEAELKAVGAAYRTRMGRHFPAMALFQVAELLEPGALVEIEITAVVPDRGGDTQ